MKIKDYELEFIEESHTYLVDGIIVPSITQMLKFKFSHKYDGISPEVLRKAAQKGTEVHKAIEDYCRFGTESDLQELHNFKFLQRQYKFGVLENETPVILELDGQPIAAGRLDLVLQIGDEIGGADIKRTSVLDKEYVALQLNLYRIAYRQSYGIEWEFLKAVHLREDKRKFINLPINEPLTWQFIGDYLNESKMEQRTD